MFGRRSTVGQQTLNLRIAVQIRATEPKSLVSSFHSSVTQWQSVRLLTEMLGVRVPPEEPSLQYHVV